MVDEREKAVTPLVKPHDDRHHDEAPKAVPTDVPASTDEAGNAVDLPDQGGKID